MAHGASASASGGDWGSMIRDNEFKYLVAGFILIVALTALLAWYELEKEIPRSWFEAMLAAVSKVQISVPLTVALLAGWEVIRVIADRIIKRLREQDREKWRAAQGERLRQAMERFGVKDEKGQVSMPMTQEVVDFLTSDDPR